MGCVDGYKGDKCDTECGKGTYGKNCLKKCSPNCGGRNRACSSVDGSCMIGCAYGYQGALCDAVVIPSQEPKVKADSGIDGATVAAILVLVAIFVLFLGFVVGANYIDIVEKTSPKEESTTCESSSDSSETCSEV
ncbi:hypothetical protein RRG08_021037 [Elysia crispata]|uniref:Uncharacterized protein n=2 Tax=Elysia crispata TaxID=231223 RepID=A0AAE1AF03_9GAST|nr:hypothetical protein RRG08_021037 [Elysia crispata]